LVLRLECDLAGADDVLPRTERDPGLEALEARRRELLVLPEVEELPAGEVLPHAVDRDGRAGHAHAVDREAMAIRRPRATDALDVDPERHDRLTPRQPPQRVRQHPVEPGITQRDERAAARNARRPGLLRRELLDDP